MPAGDITVTVEWNTTPASVTTYTIAEADAATLVKGDVAVKFKGTKAGDSAAKDWEITRANARAISYS